MAEIKCPKCGETIQLGKDAYNALLNEIEKEEIEKRLNVQIQQIDAKYKAEYALEANKLKATKDNEVAELRKTVALLEEKLKGTDKDTQLAVSKAIEATKEEIAKRDSELLGLKAQLFQTKKQAEDAALKTKEQYEFVIKAKEEEIQRWKEYRMGDSTKDLGENLEQYCHDAFDEIRADAYPNAYFEKDNESVKEEGETKGSKGDFIFRDYSPDGIELVSIMFDMKTEKDTTETKKTNESHLKKLDSDRNKKGCEYAVLVSTLEEDSKLYVRKALGVRQQRLGQPIFSEVMRTVSVHGGRVLLCGLENALCMYATHGREKAFVGGGLQRSVFRGRLCLYPGCHAAILSFCRLSLGRPSLNSVASSGRRYGR